MTFLADGERVGRLEARESQGWAAVLLDTSDRAGDEVELTLQITARKAGRRHFCFDYRVAP